MRIIPVPLAFVTLSVCLALQARAVDRYVAPGGADAGPGTNPSEPWATLAHAVEQAGDDDTILVAAGTYTENEIHLYKNLAIRGAGASLTIVQAGIAPGVATQRVFRVHSGSACAVADLTFRHGRTPADYGGGIRNDGALTLTRVTVVSNSAAGPGGGIRSQDGTLRLDDCRIEANTSSNNGGGIEIYLGTLTASNSVISGNRSTVNGGGFYNNGGAGAFVGCTINSNTAATNGGGLAFLTPVAVSNCTIAYNSAGYSGGGLHNNGTTGMVWNSTIAGNRSLGGNLYGGGGIANEGPLWLLNCTVSGNSAKRDGGGIRNNITNMTLWVRNCTIVGNTATNNGGGIDSTMGQPIVLTHTIIASNRAVVSYEDAHGVFMSGDYNLIRSTNGTTLLGTNTHNVTGAYPLHRPLEDNGGPTWTHALPTNSPAFNKGDPAFTNAAAKDQRGAPRVQHSRIDIGAYERLEPDQDGDGIDGQWEFAHGLCPTNNADATQNPDGDPFTNIEEYTANTDPQDADSFWRLESIAARPVSVGFHSSTGRVYDLEWAGALSPDSWSGLAGRTNRPGTDGLLALTDTNSPAQRRFYRVKVRVP